MKSHRTLGAFMIACAAICIIIAVQTYTNAVTTASAIAELIDGVEFESVEPPLVSYVTGICGVVLLVAGARVLFESTRKPKTDGLLPIPSPPSPSSRET